MNIISRPQVDPEPLMNIINGAEMFKVLVTAIKYGIFNLCEEPKTAKEISEIIRTDPKMTTKLLNALVSMNLLMKENDKYKNTLLASTFLVEGKPFYQGDYIKLEDTGYNVWQRLEQALKEGIKPKPMKWEEKAKELEKVVDPTFTLAMANYAVGGAVQAVVDAVKDLEEFKKAKNLLDLGGGTGIYSIAMAQANPSLECVVFDIPPVIEIAKEFVKRYGMENRFKFMAGDYIKDDFGSGYDIIFASHTFYAYPKEMLLSLLKRVYNALNDGGVIISNHWTLNEDGTGHKIVVLWDLWLALLGYSSTTRTLEEYIELLREAGFKILRVVKDISTPTHPVTILVGKKGV